MKTAQQAREDGLAAQKLVEEWFKSHGYDLRYPQMHQDKYKDIDFFVVVDGRWVSISVKANEPEYYRFPFLFELNIGWRREGPQGRYVQVLPSWYYTGRADYYLVFKRKTEVTGDLWLIDKKDLVDHVIEHGFMTIKRTQGNAHQREIAEGKEFTEVGLLSIKELRDAGIAKKIGRIQ